MNEVSEMTKIKWAEKLKYCVRFSACLNRWELSFLIDIQEKVLIKNYISFKESKVLSKIFNKAQRINEI